MLRIWSRRQVSVVTLPVLRPGNILNRILRVRLSCRHWPRCNYVLLRLRRNRHVGHVIRIVDVRLGHHLRMTLLLINNRLLLLLRSDGYIFALRSLHHVGLLHVVARVRSLRHDALDDRPLGHDSSVLRHHVIILLRLIRGCVVALLVRLARRVGLVHRTLILDVKLRVYTLDRFELANRVRGRHCSPRIFVARRNGVTRDSRVSRIFRFFDPVVLKFILQLIFDNFRIGRMRNIGRRITLRRIFRDILQLMFE